MAASPLQGVCMEYKKSALVIEDDRQIIELITMHLNDLGFRVEHALRGPEGAARALERAYDLIVLDLMLPQLDGFEICKRIREQNKQTPILMLTARSEEIDKVLGLELGADDYITKPFGVRELIARVKALMRRVAVNRAAAKDCKQNNVLRFGALTINLKNRTAMKGGTLIELTRKEFDLLEMLASNPGQAFSRQQLLQMVWGYQFDGYNHTVNTHINRLRNKIEADPSNPKYVQTVWGHGYRFTQAEEFSE
jgi:DNA-binding response OmpR family regulator